MGVLSKAEGHINPTNVQPAKCRVCPFRDRSELSELRGEIIAEMLAGAMGDDPDGGGSHLCHEPATRGEESEKICRGSRDVMIQLFHRWGFLDEPTDEAWASALERIGSAGVAAAHEE